MARVLRMPEVADDPGSARLTAWLVGESGDFVGAQSIATVETDSSLLSIEVAEAGVLVKSLVSPGQHVEPGSALAVLAAPGEVVEDVEQLMVHLGLEVAPDAQADGVHLRAVSAGDPLAATTWPPHASVEEPVPGDEEGETATEAIASDAHPTEGNAAEAHPEEGQPAEAAVSEAHPTEGYQAEAAVSEDPPDEDHPAEATASERDYAEPSHDWGEVDRTLEPAADPALQPAADPALQPAADPTAGTTAGPLTSPGPDMGPVMGWVDAVAEAVVAATLGDGRPLPSPAPLRQVRLGGLVRADRLLAVTEAVEAVSLIGLAVKAVAITCRRVPLEPEASSIATVAVQRRTPSGTIAPVVHVANLMTASSLTSAIADLDARGRVGEPEPASVLVVDLAEHGVADGAMDATRVYPAVLVMGQVRGQPVVEDGVLVPAQVLSLSLSCDAERIDVTTAARWFAELGRLLEQPLGFLT